MLHSERIAALFRGYYFAVREAPRLQRITIWLWWNPRNFDVTRRERKQLMVEFVVFFPQQMRFLASASLLLPAITSLSPRRRLNIYWPVHKMKAAQRDSSCHTDLGVRRTLNVLHAATAQSDLPRRIKAAFTLSPIQNETGWLLLWPSGFNLNRARSRLYSVDSQPDLRRNLI